MSKYLFQASFAPDGVRGLVKEGGTSRRATLEELTKKLDGTLEAFYFAFGETDVYLIADLPDHKTAAALSAAVNSTGAVQVRTVVLLTPEEIDDAVQLTVPYRPPGA